MSVLLLVTLLEMLVADLMGGLVAFIMSSLPVVIISDLIEFVGTTALPITGVLAEMLKVVAVEEKLKETISWMAAVIEGYDMLF